MKGIYRWSMDWGRSGTIEGIFSSTDSEIKNIIGRKVWLGEVLGKHSEVAGTIDGTELLLVTEDPVVVEVFEKYGLESGYNPLEYLEDEDEDEA